MSLSPDDGFLIETGTDARSTLAKIDLDGNGRFNDGAIEWSSDGSGSLANGHISWDSNGTISGPRVEVADGTTDNAWKFETTGDIKTYKKLIATEYTEDASDYYTTTIDSGLIYIDKSDDGDLYRTKLNSQGVYVYGMSTTSEYSRMMYNRIDVKDELGASTIKPESITTSKLNLGTSDFCYLTSISPYTNVYVTRISSKGSIHLEGGSVIVGDYGTSTYRPITASAFSQSSDERLKTKISDISLTAEQISEAPAIAYHWNSDETKTRQVGTIAQYWQNVLPEVVSKDSNGYLGLAYSELSAISVISLAKEIVELKKRIKELENN